MQLTFCRGELSVFFLSVQPDANDIEKYLREDPEGFEKRHINDIKGFGLFATQLFKKGDFLLFYRGERLSREVAHQRLIVSFCKTILQSETF